MRERLRQHLVARRRRACASTIPRLFAEVERLLQSADRTGDSDALILPELLGDPETLAARDRDALPSHRGAGAGRRRSLFVKRRLLMPMLRWLFEYSRDNFERQRRVNQVLFACVQELAVENARLRRELQRQSTHVP